MEKLLNELQPIIMASLVSDPTVRELILQAGRLCKKYDVPFESFYKIVSELKIPENNN